MEPSANLHLTAMAKELKDTSFIGIFDESLGAPLYSPNEFSVLGLIDVLWVIRKAKRAIKDLVQAAADADKVLLIDSPAFNIPLAKALKQAYPQKEIIYYILPKVWAWKRKRAKKVLAYTDKQLSIFPFEDQFYPTATYVGNPLMDEIKEYKQSLSANDTIAYLAGSRKGEVRRLMPELKKIQARLSDKRSVLVIPPRFSQSEIEELYGDISMFEVSRDTHKTALEASFAFAFSGTATLEIALIGTPLILLAKVNGFEFKIMRKLVKLPFIGLANIMFDFKGLEAMHPEFLQDDINIDTIIETYEKMDREKFFAKSLELRTMLQKNANKKVAEIIATSL